MRSDLLSIAYEARGQRVEVYLSAPTPSDDCGEGSRGEICRYITQDLLSPDSAYCVTFQIADLGLGEPGLERVHERRGDVNFDLEVSNGNADGIDIGEGKGLSVVVRDVPFAGR